MAGDILFLAHRIPYPPDRGDKIRSWHMLKHLGTLGRVHLACLADDDADAAHLPELRKAMGERLGEARVEVRGKAKLRPALNALTRGKPISLPLFYRRRLDVFIRDMLTRPDVRTIFAFSVQMAQYVPEEARQRFVMDFVDFDSAKFADYSRTGSFPMSWVHGREAKRLLAFERATAARANVSLFVSEAEAELFRSSAKLDGADIRAVQNGADLEFYSPKADFARLTREQRGEGPLIVFTGQMDYSPNVEAVKAFATRTLPLVHAGVPAARFAIVGRNPTDEVRRLAHNPAVLVTGAVADVRSWLDAASVVVAPLAIARGVQNKVLEAMAMAKPVVASRPAFTGIDAEAGQDLVVANSVAEQAAAITDLLASPAAAAEMGRRARQRMESVYRWEARLAPLAEIVTP